jgi:hypothetical protein
MATTTSTREHKAAGDTFIVDEMEGGEADVSEFFLVERRHMAGRDVRPLLKLTGRKRGRRSMSRQRESQSGDSHRGYRRRFGYSLPS